jgi:uncharacterized metal-binding protein
MKTTAKCGCSRGLDLMFCCSGAADTAEIGDRAVRSLHKAGVAKNVLPCGYRWRCGVDRREFQGG